MKDAKSRDAKAGRITEDQAAVVEALVTHFMDNPDAHAVLGLVDLAPGSTKGLTVGGTAASPLLLVAAATSLLDRARREMCAQPEPNQAVYMTATTSALASLHAARMFVRPAGSALQ